MPLRRQYPGGNITLIYFSVDNIGAQIVQVGILHSSTSQRVRPYSSSSSFTCNPLNTRTTTDNRHDHQDGAWDAVYAVWSVRYAELPY